MNIDLINQILSGDLGKNITFEQVMAAEPKIVPKFDYCGNCYANIGTNLLTPAEAESDSDFDCGVHCMSKLFPADAPVGTLVVAGACEFHELSYVKLGGGFFLEIDGLNYWENNEHRDLVASAIAYAAQEI